MTYEAAIAQQNAAIASFGPLMAFIGVMFVAFWVWTVRYVVWGVPDWMKSRKRPKGGLLSDWFIGYWYWFIRPLERLAIVTKLSPNAVSAMGFAVTVWGAVELFRGDFAWGGWLVIIGGTLDILDGVVARATGQSSTAGAFFDSTLDRYSDMVVFAALAGYWRDSWLMLVPTIAMGGSFMVSYTRAKAESLDIKCDHIGMFQRGERVFVLGVACALAPFVASSVEPNAVHPIFHLGLAGAALLALLGNESAVRRFVFVFRALDKRDAQAKAAAPSETVPAPSREPFPSQSPVASSPAPSSSSPTRRLATSAIGAHVA